MPDSTPDTVPAPRDAVSPDTTATAVITLDRPEKAAETPYGEPGKPLTRGPFLWGLTAALGVLTAWGLAQALVSARNVIVLIVVAMFLAVGLNPIVEALQRVRVPRRGAISIVFAGVIVLFVLFGLAIVPPVSQETSDFIKAVPGYVQELLANPTIKQLDADYQILAKLQQYVTSGDLGTTVAGGILGAGAVVLDAFFSGLTLLVLTLYFLGSLSAIKEYLLKLVPASRRTRTRAIGDEILTGIGGYVAGNVLISVIAGCLSWLFLTVAGAKYALALALVIAVADLIPLVGATVGAVLVTAVGALQSGTLAIACVIFFTVYQQVENYVIYPRVMRRSVDVAPAVSVIAALFGGALLGVVGALLAIPVAAAVALIVREVLLPRQARA
ncbi:AI-2E family transporter [Sphaerisporangium sp. B11E5]|uniref:AI-2E family transporter n=1 Tax=Sphaerisporangium sp. B11E5 TaxID=3153563 RepID=UPI00325D529F